MKDLAKEIASTLRNNKLRTALTGFAVSWGIFLLIALLGAGNGLMNSFMGNINDFITQGVSVGGWRTSKPYAGYKEGRSIQLDQKDVLYTEGNEWEGIISNVSTTTSTTGVTFTLDGNSVAGSLSGVMPDYKDQNKLKIAVGRFINEMDLKERRKVVVLTTSQAKELRPKDPDGIVGQWVNAGPVSFRVIGLALTDERSFVRICPIPYTTYKGIYDSSDKIETITFSVDGPKSLEEHKAFEDAYTGALKRLHDVAPDDNSAFWVDNGYTDNIQMSQASSIIRTALWILGLLTLVSGIVGISNIMLITVKERTHEFGIRKAIGAKPGNILSLIIAESVTITALFGYLGMLVGTLLTKLVDTMLKLGGGDGAQMFKDPTVDFLTVLMATLVMVIAGVIAGYIPAKRAVSIKPVEALAAN